LGQESCPAQALGQEGTSYPLALSALLFASEKRKLSSIRGTA
jgi:hypothetical protein